MGASVEALRAITSMQKKGFVTLNEVQLMSKALNLRDYETANRP